MGRLFFALPIPSEQQEIIRNVVSPYLDNFSTYLTPVDPSIYHVTFHFIGNIPQDLYEKLLSKCANISFPSSFSAALSTVGVFPHFFGPHVLWVSLQEHTALYAIFVELQRIIADAGIVIKPNNGFKPHITIARIKKPLGRLEKTILKKLLVENFSDAPSWKVTQINLMESTLQQDGATYLVKKIITLPE